MEMAIFRRDYHTADSIVHFMDFYNSMQMKYLASDLLNKGLSPNNISGAFTRAIKVAKSSGIDVRKHFRPVFSGIGSEIISDCKLSRLGYGLVLLNVDAKISVVALWQVDILNKFFE